MPLILDRKHEGFHAIQGRNVNGPILLNQAIEMGMDQVKQRCTKKRKMEKLEHVTLIPFSNAATMRVLGLGDHYFDTTSHCIAHAHAPESVEHLIS